MSKPPREFDVYPEEQLALPVGEKFSTWDMDNGTRYPQPIHVIEKQAYDAVVKERDNAVSNYLGLLGESTDGLVQLEKLTAALEVAESALGEIINGQFMGDTVIEDYDASTLSEIACEALEKIKELKK